ncbi:glucosyltransferase domain-containing protein [Butyrivibrio sp. XBB1001]|uniref:glucosyltransferase domain-containing protein n=1 Tax=Butyrivibrio sp. XBB1001 TaxID=1280682 RepID=UPI000401BAA3|nr:glucosyltransferase domain-containing protein [Butyrivibrio sp. XBB1001]
MIFDIFEKIGDNKKLINSFFFTAIICLAAYGFMYTHYFFYGDFPYYFMNYHVVKLYDGARWFSGVVNWLTVGSKLPWLDGCLTIVFLSLSVYLIVILLGLEKKLSIFLVAVVVSTNDSIMFGHFFYAYSFAVPLVLACFSVFVWFKKRNHIVIRIILSAIPLVFALGAYGSYATFAPTLVIIILLFEVLDGENNKLVLRKGIEYIVAFDVSLLVYYLVARLTSVINDNPITSYMGEDRLVTGASFTEIISFILNAYKKSFQRFTGIYVHWEPYVQFPTWLSIVLLISAFIVLAVEIKEKLKKYSNKCLTIALLVFLLIVFPLSAGSIYVLAFNNVHFLMIFTFSAIYLVYIKIADRVNDITPLNKKVFDIIVRKIIPTIIVFSMVFMLFKEILVANLISARLDEMQKVSDRITIQLIDRIEACEGYSGEETVILVGAINDSDYYQKDLIIYDNDVRDLLERVPYVSYEAESNNNHFYTYSTIRAYMHRVYGFANNTKYYGIEGVYDQGKVYNPDNDIYGEEIKRIVDDMECFPFNGSVVKVRDYIIVKFSDIK